MSGANLGTYFRVKQIVGLKYCENICVCSWDATLADKWNNATGKNRLFQLKKDRGLSFCKIGRKLSILATAHYISR